MRQFLNRFRCVNAHAHECAARNFFEIAFRERISCARPQAGGSELAQALMMRARISRI